jgi:hypothetical protein
MTRTRALVLMVAAAMPACVGPQIEIKDEFEVFIGGENEICGTSRCGGEGIGQGSIELDVERGELCYDLDLQDIPDPTNAHIHEGGLQEEGPVVIDLEWDGDASGGAGCVDVDPAVLRSLQENPRLRYLDVHSERYPDGAARGQFQT